MVDTITVSSRAAAAALARRRSRQIVLQLVAAEQSLQQLADVTGVSLSLLHHHVTRLCRLGLVKVTRVHRRRGRSVKSYGAVARRFVVPAHLATVSEKDALLRELHLQLRKDRAKREDRAILYFVDPRGTPRMRRLAHEDSCAFETWVTLFLTWQDARALHADIRELFARYADRRGVGARRVIAYCAMAPRTGQ